MTFYEVMRLCSEGEGRAIQEVYQAYGKQVYLYAFSLCKNPYEAEDLMQETFVKALLSLDSKKHSNVKAWLFHVCRNLWISNVRKKKNIDQRELETLTLSDDAYLILEQYIVEEGNQRLYKAILSLPQVMKEVIVLHYFSQLPQKEIATLLNLSHGSVRTLVYRGRKELREYLKGDENEF